MSIWSASGNKVVVRFLKTPWSASEVTFDRVSSVVTSQGVSLGVPILSVAFFTLLVDVEKDCSGPSCESDV